MPGARRGFDPVSYPVALSFCLCLAWQASPVPGICYGARYADIGIRRENSMIAGEMDSWFGYQGSEVGNGHSCASLRPRHTVHPVHKIQWFEYDVGRTIAVGYFELVAHFAMPGQ